MDHQDAANRYGFLDVVTVGQEFFAQAQMVLTQSARFFDLNETELRALWLCVHGKPEGATQKSLGYCLQRSATHVSIMLADMKQRGLVDSERRSPDRRKQCWRATGRGRDIALGVSHLLDDSLFAAESAQAAIAAYTKANDDLLVEFQRGAQALRTRAYEQVQPHCDSQANRP